MIWVCGVRSVRETGERIEQQESFIEDLSTQFRSACDISICEMMIQ